ncbi:hypothetical protein [Amycolatopsis regifaucium]|uniref:Uncharacterized protein n=1 Tax=Amycolatopsis regifaucium TaxID=546365 RepID=A0A154M8A7_9PSEU|nr:hypothetical protein [Amycolatopsis regifaucium]KZB80884.1 hypothetical protein AVL48_37835 [Amycolatopsis regifaucium]OKA03098.1 hypothetical protein ATP06_0238035 [Amycolatopsis regifaucium]SFJ73644.1 hypothetical protein SAMN04489731_13524 [Amycolatopsis regifaucium]
MTMGENAVSPAAEDRAPEAVQYTVDQEPIGADAARLLYADDARRLSDLVRNLVPTEREHAPGDYVHEALLVLRQAERLAALAVVVERARGSRWEEIGVGAGGITKQSAQRRWAETTEVVDALADGIGTEGLRSRRASTSRQLAEDLDAWYLRHLEPGDVADDTGQPVSGYLTKALLPPGPVRRAPSDIVRSANLLEAPPTRQPADETPA